MTETRSAIEGGPLGGVAGRAGGGSTRARVTGGVALTANIAVEIVSCAAQTLIVHEIAATRAGSAVVSAD
jgi:hypothetical protein